MHCELIPPIFRSILAQTARHGFGVALGPLVSPPYSRRQLFEPKSNEIKHFRTNKRYDHHHLHVQVHKIDAGRTLITILHPITMLPLLQVMLGRPSKMLVDKSEIIDSPYGYGLPHLPVVRFG